MAEEMLDQPTQTPEGTKVDAGGEGKAVERPGWVTSVPAEYRDKVTGYESMSRFMSDALDAIGKRGSSIARPADDASPEQWGEFWKAVGRPDSPDGYKVSADGVDAEALKAFQKRAFDQGLTPKQAQEALDWYVKDVKARQLESQKTQAKEAERVLRDEWGADFERNMTGVARVLNRFVAGDESFKDYLEDTGLGSDPRMVRMLHKVAAATGSDRLVAGSASATGKTDSEKLAEMYPSHKSKGW
jgi:hypothetical protein